MKFLLDTNIVIPAEPTSPGNLEPSSPVVVELLGVLSQGRHQVFVHPESARELFNDKDSQRRETRRLLLQKYPRLASPPSVSADLRTALGAPPADSHDAVDHALLAAVAGDAVDFLVTADVALLKKAHRANLTGRALSPAEALAVVRGLFPVAPPAPPAVERVLAYELDEVDPIFDSFRTDYTGFDNWLRTCKRQHRTAWIIRPPGRSLAGVCIVKDEVDRPYQLEGKVLKICSFKIADTARGFRFGELLLKTVFAYAFANRYDHVYVEIFEKYADLVTLFDAFGFQPLPDRTGRGETVLAKPLRFTPAEYANTSALAFNIRFGPPHVKLHDSPIFIVPIKPIYHRLLFPDVELQLGFEPGQHPFGNSIRKAYLCNANTRQITPGSVLLFYRSDDERAIRCVGVAEDALIDAEPERIARFVGQRTVYRYDEIEQMCSRPVLAILLRHARTLASPLELRALVAHQILKAAPQSIVRVRKEATEWIRDRLDQSPSWRSIPGSPS